MASKSIAYFEKHAKKETTKTLKFQIKSPYTAVNYKKAARNVLKQRGVRC